MGLFSKLFSKKRITAPKDDLVGITQAEFLRGYRVVERGGWVKATRCNSREELEARLLKQSAKLGGNAVIKFYWTRYPKGNADRFRGEGEAVLVEPTGNSLPPEKKRKTTIRTDRLVIIDGSNLIYWTKDFHIDTSPLTKLCAHLRDHHADFLVYFDANIRYLLRDAGARIDVRDPSKRDLQRIFGLFPEEIEVVPAGSRADDFILQRAQISRGIVISNDRYADYTDQHPWLGSKNRLHRGHVSQGHVYIPTLSLKISTSG